MADEKGTISWTALKKHRSHYTQDSTCSNNRRLSDDSHPGKRKLFKVALRNTFAFASPATNPHCQSQHNPYTSTSLQCIFPAIHTQFRVSDLEPVWDWSSTTLTCTRTHLKGKLGWLSSEQGTGVWCLESSYFPVPSLPCVPNPQGC